jgi:hypothetical protein
MKGERISGAVVRAVQSARRGRPMSVPSDVVAPPEAVRQAKAYARQSGWDDRSLSFEVATHRVRICPGPGLPQTS